MPRKQGLGMPKRNKTKVEGPGQARSSGGRPRKQPAEQQPLDQPAEPPDEGEGVENIEVQMAEVSIAPTAEARPAEAAAEQPTPSEPGPDAEEAAESEPESSEPDEPPQPACGHDHGPCWRQRPVYINKTRRVRGSREAFNAISAAVGVELYRCKSEAEMDEWDMKNRDEAEALYAVALGKVKESFPHIVCCDSFATGECAHGSPCECGWLQAPWPWIVHRPDGHFCDCHMELRRDWCCEWHRDWRYRGDLSGLASYPKAGSQRGDGVSGAPATICMPP